MTDATCVCCDCDNPVSQDEAGYWWCATCIDVCIPQQPTQDSSDPRES